jgi:hypothetical protein
MAIDEMVVMIDAFMSETETMIEREFVSFCASLSALRIAQRRRLWMISLMVITSAFLHFQRAVVRCKFVLVCNPFCTDTKKKSIKIYLDLCNSTVGLSG